MSNGGMTMTNDKFSANAQRFDLRERTKQFALRIIKMFTALPKSPVARILGGQV